MLQYQEEIMDLSVKNLNDPGHEDIKRNVTDSHDQLHGRLTGGQNVTVVSNGFDSPDNYNDHISPQETMMFPPPPSDRNGVENPRVVSDMNLKSRQCAICNKILSCSANLSSHMRCHTGEKPYKCEICGKSFRRSSTLSNHVNIHTGEKPYKCKICGRAFNQSGNLSTHMHTHKKGREKKYKCGMCGKAFGHSSSLKLHVNIHTGEKPYRCEVCGKSFGYLGHLTNHMRTHTGERPFKCDECGKSFSDSGHLRRHQLVHTGEKPYHCEVCNKFFTNSSNLSSHMRIHTGEKPYKCTFCDKSFTQSSNLNSHMHTHSGQRQYHCQLCGKSFSLSGNLTKHMFIHTGEKPYKCDICERSFLQSRTLINHMETHTRERPNKRKILDADQLMENSIDKLIAAYTEGSQVCDNENDQDSCDRVNEIPAIHTEENPDLDNSKQNSIDSTDDTFTASTEEDEILNSSSLVVGLDGSTDVYQPQPAHVRETEMLYYTGQSSCEETSTSRAFQRHTEDGGVSYHSSEIDDGNTLLFHSEEENEIHNESSDNVRYNDTPNLPEDGEENVYQYDYVL